MTKKSFLRVLVFYVIAIILSNVFRFDVLELNKSGEQLSVFQILLRFPLGASGVILGALISMYLLKKDRGLSFSLFGTSRKWSIVMMIVPVILLGIFGVENTHGLNLHYYGIIGGIGTIIYCFCEEIGWRGYLHDELKVLKEWQRVILIGVLWYVWHLTFLATTDIWANLQFLGWLTFGSWGIGKIIDKTKSIIAATCFHMIINVMMFNGKMSQGIEGSSKLIIVGITVAIWIVILIIWSKQDKAMAQKA